MTEGDKTPFSNWQVLKLISKLGPLKSKVGLSKIVLQCFWIPCTAVVQVVSDSVFHSKHAFVVMDLCIGKITMLWKKILAASE